jgi:hypothetical protein
MIEEKRRIDIGKNRLLVHVLNGGKFDEDEDDSRGTPGIDFPVGNENIDWLKRRS